jgi:predicted small metal-binding protein
MAKVLYCRDLGNDCDFVARGETVEEVLKIAAEHNAFVHKIEEMTPEEIEGVIALIRDE